VHVPDPRAIVILLGAVAHGDVSAHDEVLPLVYDELRMVTARAMKRARSGQPIPVSTLAQEVLVRLVGDLAVSPTNRAQFMAVAAPVLRELLVEQALARAAKTPAEATGDEPRLTNVLALDRALARLAVVDGRQARVVELRFFGGLTLEDASLALGLSPETTTREWMVARAWLYRDLAVPQ
jgi:RNA polymerase sigma factor (TIGR02999 family)